MGLICEALRSKFGMFGKEKKQKELLLAMPEIFKSVSTKNNVPMGDFPNPHKFASIMKNFEMWKFPALKPQEIQALDEALSRGVPKLLEQVEEKRNLQNEQENNPFFNEGNDANPFDEMQLGKTEWIVSQTKKQEYDQKFYSLSLTDGKASGGQIKQIMMQSKLSNNVLGKVWQLSDIDKDGAMTDQEFALCLFLIDFAKGGNQIPETLPDHFVPPRFRAVMRKKKQQQQQSQQQAPTNTAPGLPKVTNDQSAW